jgi:hypothetical protein
MNRGTIVVKVGKAPRKVKNIIMTQHRIPSPKVLCGPSIPLRLQNEKKKKKRRKATCKKVVLL